MHLTFTETYHDTIEDKINTFFGLNKHKTSVRSDKYKKCVAKGVSGNLLQ